jgi:hypothetical protein
MPKTKKQLKKPNSNKKLVLNNKKLVLNNNKTKSKLTKKVKLPYVFFDNFKSLKGKIEKYNGSIPTMFKDIKKRMKYHSNEGIKNELTDLHKGQRKLMVMELDFINYIWDEIVKNKLEDKIIFVYVGAAPSNHTTLLADLFPNWKFVLYDPREMHPALDNYKNIEINIKFFMDEDCERFKKDGYRVLLVSDIRDMTVAKNEDFNKREGIIFNDMKMQMDWVKIIKPLASSLKFRLPYTEGKTNYFDGKCKIQCWAPKQSTEGRLFVPQNYKMTTYNNKEHEEKSFYFNNVIRKNYHPHKGNCYQHNYDSAREYIIVKEFVEKVLGMKNKPEYVKQNRICKMLKDINKCVRLQKSIIPLLPVNTDLIKYNLK